MMLRLPAEKAQYLRKLRSLSFFCQNVMSIVGFHGTRVVTFPIIMWLDEFEDLICAEKLPKLFSQ